MIYNKGNIALKGILIYLLLISPNLYSQQDTVAENLFDMSLEELLNVKVTTLSRFAEDIDKAPGTVILITGEELLERGYTALSEILDDLPGMDIIRPYGANYFKNYWRGYRHGSGSSFLLLIDGMVLNNLSFNEATVMDAIPLRSIKHIEVVYGPGSSVYGANALAGLINVITKEQLPADGTRLGFDAVFGFDGERIVDAFVQYRNDDLHFHFAARLDEGDNLTDKFDEFEYTKEKYALDPRLWGEFIHNPSLGGMESPRSGRSLMLELGFAEFSTGFHYFRNETGYSTEYPLDRSLPNGKWIEETISFFASYETEISDNFKSSSQVRYHESNVPNETYSVESYTGVSGRNTFRAPVFEIWQMLAHSVEFSQQFDYSPNDDLTLSFGTIYDVLDVQKGYDYVSGPSMPVDSIRIDDYPYPDPPSDDYRYQKRADMKDMGIYAQMKFAFNEDNILHLGSRYDEHSVYGGEMNMRASYIRFFDRLSVRLNYGEAFNEPSPRLLYGGWTALGYNPDLKPERSSTLELCANYSTDVFSQNIVGFYMQSWNTILNVSDGVRNIGERDALGLEYHIRWYPEVDFLHRLKLWGYYSFVYSEGDEIYYAATDSYGRAKTGDLAPHKIQFGMTAYYSPRISFTLLGRFISERETVHTNPISTVGAFTLIDLNIRYQNILGSKIGLALRIKNLFDHLYFHPGIVSADSGDEPGYFDESGDWVGSKGWYNSLLPQFGRQVFLAFSLDL